MEHNFIIIIILSKVKFPDVPLDIVIDVLFSAATNLMEHHVHR